MHFRAVGEPLAIARAIYEAIETTSTPLPQHPPAHPATPLYVHRLESILHGSETVGAAGVISVTVPRKQGVMLGGSTAGPRPGSPPASSSSRPARARRMPSPTSR